MEANFDLRGGTADHRKKRPNGGAAGVPAVPPGLGGVRAAPQRRATVWVTFDGDRLVLLVSGDFDMTVDYKDYLGYSWHESSANRRYVADLLWDSSQLLLVNIAGKLS